LAAKAEPPWVTAPVGAEPAATMLRTALPPPQVPFSVSVSAPLSRVWQTGVGVAEAVALEVAVKVAVGVPA
jgi:hypothetical protein